MDIVSADSFPISSMVDTQAVEALTQVEALLDRFAHFGVELGLERIERLLAALGNPQHQVPILHIAGSNGKGSVCAFLSSVLTEAGYRVGRYTSPHLVSWCERICLNQQAIAPTELRDLLQQVVAAIDPAHSSPTQFEVITAAAWLYFAQQQVDIAVMEVGLGGRLDATNVCDRPLVSVITSLSREHWQRLGPTLADITREKAGILKPGCPAVIAPQLPEAAAVLQERVTTLNCPTLWVKPAEAIDQGWAEFQGAEAFQAERFQESIDSLRYPLPMLGAHQLINSALAIATLQILQAQGWRITQQHILDGMAKTQWIGRLQWLSWQGQPLLIDGAHNPAGAAALRQYLDSSIAQSPHDSDLQVHPPIGTPPIHWVMGMIANKDHAEVFQALLRPGDFLYLVPVPEHLPVDLPKLADLARATCPQLQHCSLHENVIAGLQAAQQIKSPQEVLVLCGSLYLIGFFFKLTQKQ